MPMDGREQGEGSATFLPEWRPEMARKDGGNTADAREQPHDAARPMKVVVDREGCTWLCDKEVDETKELKTQGCWRCAEMAFTRND
jgi:hypothetical protein